MINKKRIFIISTAKDIVYMLLLTIVVFFTSCHKNTDETGQENNNKTPNPSVKADKILLSFEEAHIRESDNFLIDNEKEYVFLGDGNYVTEISDEYSRKGAKSIRHAVNYPSSKKNRSEHCLFQYNHTSGPEPISPGEERYYGFSFLIDPNSKAPVPAINLHQIKQTYGTYSNSPPFIQFGWFDTDSRVQLQCRSGIHGAEGGNRNSQNLPIQDIEKGIWYDVVVGWKFAPRQTNGWVKCWIKTISEKEYTEYTIGPNIKVGYELHPDELRCVKFGDYASGAAGTSFYFDEIRWAKTFDKAKITID